MTSEKLLLTLTTHPLTVGSIKWTRISSLKQDTRMAYTAFWLGRPINWIRSARSKNAESKTRLKGSIRACDAHKTESSDDDLPMISVILDVAMMRTFDLDRNLSIWVSTAFTTRIESLGSEPFSATFLAAVRLSTSSMKNMEKVKPRTITIAWLWPWPWPW